MDRQLLEKLLGSVREAGAVLRGRRKASRRIVVRSSGVRIIRERVRPSDVLLKKESRSWPE
jgi:hypothetical protein